MPSIVADQHPAVFALTATMPGAGRHVPAAIEAINLAGPHIGLIVGGASVPAGFPRTPQVVLKRSISGIVEAADGLVRRARLN